VSKIRVLIVDDAVVIRRIVSDVLGNDPDIEVAGTAANGKIGLAKISQVNPDLVTMDVEMPEMDGVATLRELRRAYPKLPVIMFSTLTARGASATLDALAAGASDYVTKPANVGSVAVAMNRIREELIPKIKALCAKSHPTAAAPLPAIPSAPLPMAWKAPMTTAAPAVIHAVAIGISTGGPNALAEVIPALPGDLPVPIFIVQHMPPVFTRLLAERLDQKANVTVKEAVNGEIARPGCVYIAPGDFHMTVSRESAGTHIALNQGVPENSCRPAVDVLFRSIARGYGASALAAVLTGMGQDGCRGAQSIREAGGRVIAQDEATSTVWGMPGCVARAGLAEQLIPLNQVTQQIVRRVMAGRSGADQRGTLQTV
jgi:two-component system chemotaxis response regulator CheB